LFNWPDWLTRFEIEHIQISLLRGLRHRFDQLSLQPESLPAWDERIGFESPRDFEIVEAGAVDLIERRVPCIAQIPSVRSSLTILRAVLGKGQRNAAQNAERDTDSNE
jgi:hypothetical protein